MIVLYNLIYSFNFKIFTHKFRIRNMTVFSNIRSKIRILHL